MVQYADDTVLYKCIKTSDDSQDLQSDLKNISLWCSLNGLNINVNKCKYIRMSRSRNCLENSYVINEDKIPQCANMKLLGIIVSSDLKWNLQTREARRKPVLYASECLVMARKGSHRKLESKEKKILRRMLGPVREEDGTYRIQHNNELYEHQEDARTS